MMTIDEMIAVLTHYKNGGVVQCKHKSESIWQTFTDCDPRWDFVQFAYRAKPDPLVLWAEYSTSGKLISVNHAKDQSKGNLKKFVEVEQ